MERQPIGTLVKCKSLGEFGEDITVGSVYTVVYDEDGDMCFIDDAGEYNWNISSPDGLGRYEVVKVS